MSRQQACGLIGLSRSSYYYQGDGSDDEALRKALKEKAVQKRRYGYRRLLVLLRREGWTDNHKRVFRVYQDEGLQVRRRKRKHAAKWRGEKLELPMGMNQRWSMDFVHDCLAGGRRIAVFYEKEVEQQSRLATSLLEPMLILIVGLVVGFIVAAMLLPIFELSTIIR